MNNLAPLLTIPVVSFFKTLDHNSSILYDLRLKSERVKGYFMVRNQGPRNDYDTFHLTGTGFVGSWYLGRIRTVPSSPKFPYVVEIYRKSRIRSSQPSLLSSKYLTEDGLAAMIRKLDAHGLLAEYPSDWEIVQGSTFADLGLDLF